MSSSISTSSGAGAVAVPATVAAKRRLTPADVSQLISFSRLTLIAGLVFLHYGNFPNLDTSPFRGTDFTDYPVAAFINSFALFFFFSAVPLLSMISGWLFFSFSANPLGEIRRRIRKRFMSLYVPLVLWNMAYLAVLLVAYWLTRSTWLMMEAKVDLATAGAMDLLNSVLAITHKPIGFQFWFVRDLFVTVLISPILWVLLRTVPFIGGFVLVAGWLCGFDFWIFFRSDVVCFFYLGALLRLRNTPLEIPLGATCWLLAGYVLLVGLRAAEPYLMGDAIPFLDAATRSMRIVGVLACWGLFQHIAFSTPGATVARYGGFAFFVFCVHYPLIGLVKASLWPLLPAETQFWMIVHYFASVTITFILSIVSAMFMSRVAPKQFVVLNGGRPAS